MTYYKGEDFDTLVSKGNFLIDFYADWCGPCKMMEPILEDISSDINIIKVNTDEMPKTTFKYRIMSIPTLIIFRDGNIINELVGVHTKDEILENIRG